MPAQGAIAQQIFWYTAFTADMVKPGIAVMDGEKPKWRMAPSPRGAYYEDGMKLGYQDAGAWTLMNSTPTDRAKAAWLYAQFTVSKTVSLKKSHVGLTFIRESDIWDKSMTERAPSLGGLIEFYRSNARASCGPRPAPMCRTIQNWRSFGGRISAMPCQAKKPRNRQWTAWRQPKTKCSCGLNAPMCKKCVAPR